MVVECRGAVQVQQLERLTADVPAAEDLEDLQPSGNKSGAFEEMASPSQQHLQQQLINVLAQLSLRDSFIALPAVSRSMHQLLGRPSSKCPTRLSWFRNDGQ